MADWSPQQYSRFEGERTRPARDLLAQVNLENPRHVVDMGCGPGNSTELMAMRYPEAQIVGLDSSSTMLEAARQRLPHLRFEHADAARWLPAPDTELVFANAVYQWVPEHLSVLPSVLGALGSGAVLAVQMPDNLREPSHQLMRQVAQEGPWASRLAQAAREPLPSIALYYDALRPFAARLEIWHTIYNHVLAGPDEIVEWVKSTGLRPFIDRLEMGERAQFLERYRGLIAEAYRPLADGKVLLRFPRLFIAAQR